MQLHGSEILPGANLGECIELLLSDFYTTKCWTADKLRSFFINFLLDGDTLLNYSWFPSI